jgi:predicted deacylase
MAGYDATDPRSLAAARISGFPIVWGHPVIAPGRTISCAKARGIPFLYTEARGCGRVHPEDLALFRAILSNLLAHLSIVPGTPRETQIHLHLYGDGNIEGGLMSTRHAFLVPRVSLLDTVTEGQTLGILTDTLGNCLEEIAAPANGVVALIHEFRVVKPDEPLFLVTGVSA